MKTFTPLSIEQLSKLLIQPIEIKNYLIIQIQTVSVEASNQRFVNAAVLCKSNDIWNENTLHLIELKHCFNRASKGPKSTQFVDLINKILIVTMVEPPKYGELKVISWSLINLEDEFINDELALDNEISDEDLMLIYDQEMSKNKY